jgi:hypothetical protein
MHRLLSICLFTPSTSPFSPLSTSLRFHYSGSRKTVKLHHLGMAAIFSRPWKRWHLQSFTSGAIHRSCWRVSCYMIGRLHGPIVPFSVRQKPVRSCGRGAFCSASHRNQRADPNTGLECQFSNQRLPYRRTQPPAGDRTLQVVTVIVRVSGEARE